MRLVGAILLEQNDEWQLQHRYMTQETMITLGEELIVALATIAA
jgi:putative transposase